MLSAVVVIPRCASNVVSGWLGLGHRVISVYGFVAGMIRFTFIEGVWYSLHMVTVEGEEQPVCSADPGSGGDGAAKTPVGTADWWSLWLLWVIDRNQLSKPRRLG